MEGLILLSEIGIGSALFALIVWMLIIQKRILSLQERNESRLNKLQYQVNDLGKSVHWVKKSIEDRKSTGIEEVRRDSVKDSLLCGKSSAVQKKLRCNSTVNDAETRVKGISGKSYACNTESKIDFSVCETASESENNFIKNAWNWFLYGGNPDEVGTASLGGVWLLRSAVLIILCGVFFFLKYSVDNGVISPLWRFWGAIAGGAGTLFAAWKSERNYKILPQGLYSIGFAVIFAAFYTGSAFYAFYSVTTAVILMTAVSFAGGITAYRKEYQITACLSAIGSYMASVILFVHSSNIFVSLMVVASAVLFILVLSLLKEWKFASYLGLSGGYGIISLISCIADKEAFFIPGITVASLIFLINTAYILLRSVFMNRKTGTGEILYFLINSIWYFIFSGILIGINTNYRYTAWVTIGITVISVINLMLIKFTEHKKFDLSLHFGAIEESKDKILYACNCGQAGFFAVATLPLLFSGSVLCVSFSAGALIMLYIGNVGKNKIFYIFSALLYFFSLIHLIFVELSLMADRMHAVYALDMIEYALPFILFIISTALGAWIVDKMEKSELQNKIKTVLYALSVSVLFVFLSFETVHFVTNFISKEFCSGAVSILWSLFAATFLVKGLKGNKNSVLRNIGFILFGIVVCKVFFIDIVALKAYFRIAAFIILGVILLSSSVFYEKVIKE